MHKVPFLKLQHHASTVILFCLSIQASNKHCIAFSNTPNLICTSQNFSRFFFLFSLKLSFNGSPVPILLYLVDTSFDYVLENAENCASKFLTLCYCVGKPFQKIVHNRLRLSNTDYMRNKLVSDVSVRVYKSYKYLLKVTG